MPFLQHGFLRVACGVPVIRVADPAHNAAQINALLQRAEAQDVALVVFPELCLTGYSCGDLFHQSRLQQAALCALDTVRTMTRTSYRGVAVVGLPAVVEDQLFNCAAVLAGGEVVALVPKRFLPNYKEFYEARYFSSGQKASASSVRLGAAEVAFSTSGLVRVNPLGLILGVEICEDLWVPEPPSSAQALAGATVLCNLSASNDLIGKAAYRRELVVAQSGRCLAGYLYASCGWGESTTDVVYGGHCLIAENGTLLAESPRFQREPALLVTELDLEHLTHDRIQQGSFSDALARLPLKHSDSTHMPSATITPVAGRLTRRVDPHPFVPASTSDLRQRCEEIFSIQVAGLAQRLEAARPAELTLGVSGGLDSTLALLVACRTLDILERPRTDLVALTLPGYGTSRRTLENARTLLHALGVSWHEIDIRALCLAEWQLLGHRPWGIDLTGLEVDGLAEQLRQLPADPGQDLVFENVQARVRTNLLMNRGFVVGTGDLSELAVGWCTYNADHMSMYNPNVSIPKTLVKWLVKFVADTQYSGVVQAALLDVVGTEISPELLPLAADGTLRQRTEATIGPYELIDFYLYHFLRFGTAPAKLLWLADQATFHQPYTGAELRHWLTMFLRRFFANQFKRSCLPDGPKVGSVSLSPRGDWRMPSDAAAAAWLAELAP